MKQFQQGFTLIEVMIVLVIVGVLAALAAPTFTSSIRKSQLNADLQSVTDALVKARIDAVMKKRNFVASATSSTNGYAYDLKYTQWSGRAVNVNFNYMGFASQAGAFANTNTPEACYVLTHKSDSTIQRVIVVSRTGSVSAPRNRVNCS